MLIISISTLILFLKYIIKNKYFTKFLNLKLELSFDPLLVTCFEGLIEEKHPYNFIA